MHGKGGKAGQLACEVKVEAPELPRGGRLAGTKTCWANTGGSRAEAGEYLGSRGGLKKGLKSQEREVAGPQRSPGSACMKTRVRRGLRSDSSNSREADLQISVLWFSVLQRW